MVCHGAHLFRAGTNGLFYAVLFTIAHLIVTDIFPSNMHALAGAVFNTVAQLGTSLGMSVIAIVSSSVINSSLSPDKHSPEALMVGYRAAFALCFVLMLLSALTSFGLRTVGRLGSGRVQLEP
jgi:MFS family permease